MFTPWITTLDNYLPLKQKLHPKDIMTFLDSAVELQKHYPEKNVLKYAARTAEENSMFTLKNLD